MSAVSSESHEPAGEPGQPPHRSPPRDRPISAPTNGWSRSLYQRYLADPGSVDRAWWSFFADYQPSLPNGTGPQPVINLQAAPAPAQAPAPPRRRLRSGPRRPRRLPRSSAPAPRRPGPPRSPGPRAPAPGPPPPPPPPAEGTEVSRLRGAAARTVSNMTASLAVPTATSVRAIPAKLLVDNRIVINNHLRRGRGGKVSFTHLIGYAVVKALVALPEMNLAYAEENGKPAVARPDHVNLGLAIDVRTSDGGRQLLVPNLKAAEEMDFRQFWTTYEDIVRRARSGKLAVADFRRHHRDDHQPRHDRHRALGAAADGRPGLHRGRGRDGVPGRLRRGVRGDPGPAGDQQVGHAHLDL